MPAGGVLTAAMSRSPLNKRPPDGDANLDGDGKVDSVINALRCDQCGYMWHFWVSHFIQRKRWIVR